MNRLKSQLKVIRWVAEIKDCAAFVFIVPYCDLLVIGTSGGKLKGYMSILHNSSKLLHLALSPKKLMCDVRYLFMFSHMRSRSSVLSHILGNNPEICGYKELHLSYKSRFSLLRMRAELSCELDDELSGKYLFDKVLNNYEVSQALVKQADPKVIFLLRGPEATVKSIINMGDITGIEWYKDPEKAMNYYCARLEALEVLAGMVGECVFIDSNDLVDNPEIVLGKLDKWLNLTAPLNKKYSSFSGTGSIGDGDPSENIKSGVLTRTKEHEGIALPKDILRRGEVAYDHCRQLLLRKNKF